jgi:hypothetical protein
MISIKPKRSQDQSFAQKKDLAHFPTMEEPDLRHNNGHPLLRTLKGSTHEKVDDEEKVFLPTHRSGTREITCSSASVAMNLDPQN